MKINQIGLSRLAAEKTQQTEVLMKTRSFLLAAGVLLALAFTFSCDSNSSAVECLYADSGTFTDDRDGKEYKYVPICSQIWMAENLDYEVEGSRCYGNDPANCTKYGRLYNWNTAKTACPKGWHLPSNAEWDVLMTAIGDSAGTKLKSTDGWNSNGNGTDEYEFSALPGGNGNSNGSFDSAGDYGNWLSSTEYSSYYAYGWYMYYNYSGVHRGYLLDKSYLYSVRCLKD